MKHKLKITILSILFGLLFGIPVYADSNTYIIDQSDVLGEYISTLNEKAETISEEAGLRITCMITNTTEGMGTPAVSEQVYKGLFADDPGFMLIYSIDDQEWFIYSSGMESAPLTEEQENELWNEFAIQDYYVDCVDAYLDAAAAICSVDSQGVAEPAATDSQGDDQTAGADTSETTEVSGSNTQEAGSAIPQERQLPLLVDDAGLLTEEEADALLDKLEEISERQECEVAVVTVDSLEGKTSQDYADDFYDYNGYGYGKDDDGILLLISMEDRDYAITTYGFGITAFTDAGLQYVVNDFKPALSGGRYGDAFNDFADCCDKFLTQAHTGEPYDGDNMPKGTVHPVYIHLPFIWFPDFFTDRKIEECKTEKCTEKRISSGLPGGRKYAPVSEFGCAGCIQCDIQSGIQIQRKFIRRKLHTHKLFRKKPWRNIRKVLMDGNNRQPI